MSFLTSKVLITEKSDFNKSTTIQSEQSEKRKKKLLNDKDKE